MSDPHFIGTRPGVAAGSGPVLPEVPAWMALAVCTDVNPDWFFPLRGNAKPHQTAHALAACGRCPVRDECLTWAEEERIDHGIWGGLTAGQRAKRRKGLPARPRLVRAVCYAGHRYVEENVRVRADGTRVCLKCEAKRQRDYRARLDAEEVAA